METDEEREIEQEIEAEEAAIRMEQSEKVKLARSTYEAPKSPKSLESFDDFEQAIFYTLHHAISSQKLMDKEYMDKWRIVLVGEREWSSSLSFRSSSDDIITVVLPYKHGEITKLVQMEYGHRRDIMTHWKKAIANGVPKLYNARRQPFAPSQQWTRITKEGKKLIKERLNAKVSDLFDLAELGRIKVTCEKKITIRDSYTGFEKVISVTERLRASDLPAHEQLGIAERLKLLDAERFGTKDEEELFAQEIKEFTEKEIR